MVNIHVYTDSFSIYYTYACWQFQYTPHCVLMTTLLLTQSVLVLTLNAGVRINVIIIWIVHTLLVCEFVRRSGSLMRVCESHVTFCCLDTGPHVNTMSWVEYFIFLSWVELSTLFFCHELSWVLFSRSTQLNSWQKALYSSNLSKT